MGDLRTTQSPGSFSTSGADGLGVTGLEGRRRPRRKPARFAPPRGARLVPLPAPLRPAHTPMKESMSDEVLFPKMYAADQTGEINHFGTCSLCLRTMHNMTAHHVHPRVHVGGGVMKRGGPAGFTEAQLGVCIDACVPCHRIIHQLIPNAVMGMEYYSADLLRSQPRVKAWADWVVQQPQPPVPIEGAGRPLSKRQLSKQQRREDKRPHKATMSTDQIRIALQKMWTENGDTFPRWEGGPGRKWKRSPKSPSKHRIQQLVIKLADLSDLLVNAQGVKDAMKPIPQYREWYLWLFDTTQLDPLPVGGGSDGRGVAELGQEIQAADRNSDQLKRRKLIRNEAKNDMLTALDKIWADNGGAFPRWTGASQNRAQIFVERLRGVSIGPVSVPRMRKALLVKPRYYAWAAWLFDPDVSQEAGGSSAGAGDAGAAAVQPQMESEFASVVRPQTEMEVVADEYVDMMDGHNLTAAAEVIDLTAESDQSYAGGGWVDVDDPSPSEVGGPEVIDLTLGSSDENNEVP